MTKKLRARLMAGGITGVGLLAAASWFLHTTSTVDVTTAAVTSGTITHEVLASGTLQPVKSVDIGAQASGTIAFIGVDFNTIVHKGDVLARLDPSTYQAQLQLTRASLAQAEADQTAAETELDNAKVMLKRTEQLTAAEVATKEDLENARLTEEEADSAVGDARSAVSRAKAIVQEAEVNLQHTVITSPIDGIIVSRNVDVGQTLISTMQAPSLFDIAADLTRMEVQVDIDQSDMAGLQDGEAATFQVESYPHQTFQGTLAEVRLNPIVATGNAVSYTGIVIVNNADERLRPGMTAVVDIPGAHATSIRIPNRALEFRPAPDVLKAIGEAAPALGKATSDSQSETRLVWEYNGKTFTPIQVRGGLTDEVWTQVVSGSVQPGDQLVTSALVEHHHSRL